MWLASYLATLAKNTAWSRHELLWELDYLTGLQLEHSYLRAAGLWTIPVRPPEAPVDDAGVDALLASEPAPDLNAFL